MKREYILIGRDGKEKGRLPKISEHDLLSNAWVFYDGSWWGFGVAKLNGEIYFYQASPTAEQLKGGAQ